jgi:hypothetical protein
MRASRLLTLALALVGAASAASAQTSGGTGGREIPKIDPRQAPLPYSGWTQPPPARATGSRPVSLEDGLIRLSVPGRLEESGPEMIPVDLASFGAPDHLFMDPRGTAAVAVTLQSLGAAPLSTLRALLEQRLGRQHRNVRFLTREVVELEGRRWVHLELTYDGERTTVHKRVLAMWFRGAVIIVELAGRRGSAADDGDVFRETMHSIRIRS